MRRHAAAGRGCSAASVLLFTMREAFDRDGASREALAPVTSCDSRLACELPPTTKAARQRAAPQRHREPAKATRNEVVVAATGVGHHTCRAGRGRTFASWSSSQNHGARPRSQARSRSGRRGGRTASPRRPLAVRREGDTVVFPVIEEILVTRLRLIEEVRVRVKRSVRRDRRKVRLRREELNVERRPAAASSRNAGVEPD